MLSESVQDVPKQEQRTVAALYVRVSSRDQLKGYSMDVQASRLKAFCQSNNYLYRIYRDGGESASSMNRPAFQELLWDAGSLKFQIVIVDKIDRLVRSIRDLIELHSFLDELGIGLRSLSEPIDTSHPMSKYFLYLLGLFSEMELDWSRERSEKGRQARLLEGKYHGGSCAFGYRFDQESGKLVINEEEAIIVKMIFNQYLRIQSIRGVEKYLNDQNIQTRNGVDRWSDSTVAGILHRRCYTGKLVQAGITSHIEAILSVEDYDRVQKILKERSKLSPKRREIKPIYDNQMFCYQCGRSINEEMRFCRYCGVGLIFEDIQ